MAHALLFEIIFLSLFWENMFIGKVYEKLIAEMFGDGRKVDVSDITVEFDLAAQIGRNKE